MQIDCQWGLIKIISGNAQEKAIVKETSLKSEWHIDLHGEKLGSIVKDKYALSVVP